MTFCKFCKKEYRNINQHLKTKKHIYNENCYYVLCKICNKRNKCGPEPCFCNIYYCEDCTHKYGFYDKSMDIMYFDCCYEKIKKK